MSQERVQILLNYARAHDGRITTEEANNLLSKFYYHNAEHYVSMILTRLVRSGMMKRVKRGHYELVSMNRSAAQLADHPTLF